MSKFLQKAVGRGLREAGAVLKEEGGAEVRQKIQSRSLHFNGALSLSLSRVIVVGLFQVFFFGRGERQPAGGGF